MKFSPYKIYAYFSLLRPHQWLKNIIVGMPLFFHDTDLDIKNVYSCLILFILFSLIASFVYVLNDVSDIAEDRKHILKKKRVIASGAISRREAMVIALLLILLTVLCFFILEIKQSTWSVLLAYIFINIGYSFYFKNIPLVEMCIVASGFGLRISAGSFETDISLSPWIMMCVISGSLFIVIGKRFSDLKISSKNLMRKVFQSYTEEFLKMQLTLQAAVLCSVYLMFVFSDYGIQKFGVYLPVTGLPVFLSIQRYVQLVIVFSEGSDPTKLILSDKFILICAFVTACMFIGLKVIS